MNVFSLVPRPQKTSGPVLTVCALMRLRSIPHNLGNPVISVNCCSLSRPENEASLDARLLTNVNIEGGRGYRPGSWPLYAAIETQRDYKP